MEKLFNIASNISTPLGLAGFFAAAVFFIFRMVLKITPSGTLRPSHASEILKRVIDRLFILSLVAMVLGFCGYIYVKGSTLNPQRDPTKIPSNSGSQVPLENAANNNLTLFAIKSLQLLDASELATNNKARLSIKALVQPTTAKLYFDSPEDFKMVFAFYLEGVEHGKGDVDIDVSYKLVAEMTEPGSIPETYHDSLLPEVRFDAWRTRDTAKAIGISEYLKFFGLSAKDVDSQGVIPFIVVVSELTNHQIPKGKATLVIQATDKKSHQTATKSLPFEVGKK